MENKDADLALDKFADRLAVALKIYRSEKNGNREGLVEAIDAVREFILSIPSMQGKDLEHPFLGLQVALYEAEEGKANPLLAPRQVSTGEAPRKLLRDVVIENAAALTLSALMKLGCKSNEASKLVAKFLRRHDFYGGTRQAHGVSSLEKRIVGWRVEIRKALRKSDLSFEARTYNDMADALLPSLVAMEFGIESGALPKGEAIASLLRRLEGFFTEPPPF